MDYESFKEKFVEDLKDRLDEQGADVKVSVNTVNKLNESYDAGTVTAGSINQYIYGSYAGSLDNEGYINIPLWLIVNGTVTVLENGVIEVAATNTWGQGIYSRLGEYPEGIENTEAGVNTVKTVRNGQLIIIKNGVEYNAQGTIVK